MDSYRAQVQNIQQSVQDFVLFSVEKNCGIITLNRPQALNALHKDMMTSIRQQLIDWREDPNVLMVLVHSKEGKAFCSGGDLRFVYEMLQVKNFQVLEDLFRTEYTLNYIIRTYPKPYVAVVDGIVMGGGMGLSVNGALRITGEKTIAAMPETNIGFFPDVGATTFLNQCPGSVGLYLGLTANHIKYQDALYANFFDSHCPSPRLDDLKAALINAEDKTHIGLKALAQSYEEVPPHGHLYENRLAIEQHFNHKTLGEIFSSLESDSSDFSLHTLNILGHRSPRSLAVAFQQLTRGKTLSAAQGIQMEFHLSQNFLNNPDFFEGIRAAIIDKDRTPHWAEKTIQDVEQKKVDGYFTTDLKDLDL